MANQITRGNVQGKAILTAGGVVVGAPASYVIQRVLGVWKVLDPVSDALGRWLKVSVSAEQLGWTVALMVVGALFGLLLWKVWRPVHIHHGELTARVPTAVSMDMVFTRADENDFEPVVGFRTDGSEIDPQRDATLHQGLSYAVFGDWDHHDDNDEALRSSDFETALERFHQSAFEGRLSIWGRPFNFMMTNLFRPVPADHWTTHEVQFTDAMREKSSSRSKLMSNLESFVELMICKAEFEREWSHAG